jgi:hypothetical protein
MAVTYLQEPQEYSPSDSPLVWMFESTNYTQANFSFIVTLIVNGQNISIHQIFSERAGKAHFDASELVRSLVSSMSIPQSFVSSFDATNFKTVSIQVKEKYGAPATIQPTTYSSTQIKAFKSSLCGLDFQTFNYSIFRPTGIKRRFLTDNVERIILPNDSTYYSYIADSLAGLDAVYETFDVNRFLLNTYVVSLSATTIKTLNVSLAQIGVIDSGANLDLIHYIELSVQQPSSTVTSIDKHSVQIWRDCFDGATIYWINKYGAIDSFSLTHNITESVDIESFSYEKQFGNWSEDSSAFEFDINKSGTQGLQKNMIDKLELSSGWIVQEQQHFLQSAIESPFVILKSGFDYIKGTVKNSGFEKGQDEYEELLQVNLTFVPSTIRKSIIA